MIRRSNLRVRTTGPADCCHRGSAGLSPCESLMAKTPGSGESLSFPMAPIQKLVSRMPMIFAFMLLALLCVPATSFPADASGFVIVDIDDASLARFGRWPWPRDLQARLLRATEKFSPKAVVVDLLLSESDVQFPEKDRELADSIGASGNVFLAFAFQFGRQGVTPELERLTLLQRNALAKGRESIDELREANGLLFPVPLFARKAAGLGFVNVFPESRGSGAGPGLVRRGTLVVSYRGEVYPSLPLALVSWLKKLTLSKVIVHPGDRIETEDVNIPVDSAGDIPLSFTAPGSRFPRVSAERVLGGEDLSAPLQGAIVIIGVNATGLSDYHPTPVSSYHPGTELLATAIDALLSKWPSRAR